MNTGPMVWDHDQAQAMLMPTLSQEDGPAQQPRSEFTLSGGLG